MDDARPQVTPSPRLSMLVAFLGALGIVLVAWGIVVVQWETKAQARRQVLAEQTALRLADWVHSRMLVLESIRAMRRHGLLEDPADWRQRAELDLEAVKGLQAISWLDRDTVIRIIVPLAGNESALGRAVLDHPVAGSVIRTARDSHQVLASPPLDLFQGGRGFTAYYPVVDDDGVLLGFVNGVFRVDRIVADALDHIDLAEHRIALIDSDPTLGDGALLWRSSDVALPLDGMGIATIGVAGRNWTVEIAPAVPVIPRSRHVMAVLLALLAGVLAAGLAAWSHKQQALARASKRESDRYRERVTELERMESLGRVAGGIAHDFNNILGVVVGRCSMLQEEPICSDDEVRLHLEAIMDAGERGAALVEMLLTFARRGTEVEGVVDAAKHIRSLEPLLRHISGREVDLVIDIRVEQAHIGLAPAALDRLLINLVTNARDAVQPGGRIVVGLAREPDGFCLGVLDDGQGMDAATRSRIFEPFFTTRPDGTGLGLPTVFGLVRQAGGRLEVESTPGKGSLFKACLPEVPRNELPEDDETDLAPLSRRSA